MRTASLNLTRASIFGGTFNGEVVEGWDFLYKECDAKDYEAYKKLVIDAVENTVIELDDDDEKVIYCSYDDITSHDRDEKELFSCCDVPDAVIREEFEKMSIRYE